MEPRKNVQFVTQYRAEITLDPETTCVFNSTNEEALLKNIRNVLGGDEPRIEASGQGTTDLVYHHSHFNGRQPVGWIAELSIPQPMSVKNITETRFAAQKAA